jgi:hypothetical protein
MLIVEIDEVEKMVGFPDIPASGELIEYWLNDMVKVPYYEIKYIQKIYTGVSVIESERVMKCPADNTALIVVKKRNVEKL